MNGVEQEEEADTVTEETLNEVSSVGSAGAWTDVDTALGRDLACTSCQPKLCNGTQD